jgi:serine-type D-Ala-D-Ala carboxypeptidase/endopeptidase (penicillin-binding protein 4)
MASATSASDFAAQIDNILSAPAVTSGKLGVCIRRLDDAVDLYSRDADTPLVPASNMKILTTAAALHYLGPDYRFTTEILGEQSLAGVISGDLIIRGNGDPSLVPERLWYLATRLIYAGAHEITGNIVVDDSYFAGPRMANGWEQDRSSSAYMAPTGAVSIGFNVIQVHVLPSSTAGAAAKVLIDPASDYAAIEGTVTTVAKGRTYVNVDVVPVADRSHVRVSGRINLTDPGRSFWRRIDNPPVFAGEVMKAALQQLGITVRGKVKVAAAPDNVPRLATLTSVRLAEIVNSLNKSSNNFAAEQVALTLGAARFGPPATWEKAQSAIEAFLEGEVGLKHGSYQIRNGSGLHDVNRVSPRQIVSVLEYMRDQPAIAPEFVTSLAVAAGSGTLSERMQKTDAAHLLRAKTGTLSTASALSGYVTAKSGETVAFSILVNDYPTPISEVWAVQDQLGALLAGLRFGAGGEPLAAKPAAAVEVAIP